MNGDVVLLYVAAIPGFFMLLAVEALVGRRRRLRLFESRDSWACVAMGVGNFVLELPWAVVQASAYVAISHAVPWHLGSGWAGWLVGMVAVDLAYYGYHRMSHETRLLWASHVVHHSSRRYNLAVALRQPWLVVTVTPFLLPLALLGLPLEIMLSCFAFNLFYQFWVHTELIGRLPRWYEFVLNTPSHHRVHHGSNPQYLDRNYGGILILWDRLFRSFEPEGEPVVYGLTKNIATYNPLRIATHELLAIAHDVRRTPRWADRAGRLLHGPAWQPVVGRTA